MSLYDDVDGDGDRAAGAADVAEVAGAGWAPGIRLLQTHLKAKRALGTGGGGDRRRDRRERRPPRPPTLPPVVDLKSRRSPPPIQAPRAPLTPPPPAPYQPYQPYQSYQPSRNKDADWDVVGEYDPMRPNDYEKTVKELRDQRDRDNDSKYDDKDRKAHRKRKSRFGDDDDPQEKLTLVRPEEEHEILPPTRSGGAAIAPPPSLREPEPPSPPRAPPASFERPEKAVSPAVNYGGNSVAAKIMAKYGFKEGQGLGKKEQGMSMALQVEKTSKRGGRIIHEKDGSVTFPSGIGDLPRPGSPTDAAAGSQKVEPTITEIMKSPSKVVLLRNMVGPGDVDEELEPEVKDECHIKYGDVIKVVIFEIPEAPSDEAVRIFVEFKRIESAIKAVVDLNGRFFGGRQVKAGFYSVDQFANLQLLN